MYYMATMTINVSDEIEQEFRDTVKKKLGTGKGTLGKAIEDAMKKWLHEKRQKQIAYEAMELMRKGLYTLPKGWKFNRDELYDRQ